jgi:hypothetical protein
VSAAGAGAVLPATRVASRAVHAQRGAIAGDGPLGAVLGLSLLFGALSLLIPSALGYDPWAWLVWGREILRLDLSTTAGPSWKPLPSLVAAPLALFGDAQPELWLAVARAGAFLAVYVAYRLATRLAGVAAGMAAAAGLVLAADFFVTALRGYSEPWLVAFALLAFERHLDGRRLQALVLIALAALIRPEAWFFLVGYGAWMWLVEPEQRTAVALATLAAFAIWLGLDWVGSGEPLGSSRVAQEAAPGTAAATAHPALTVLQRAVQAVIVPVLACAVTALVLAWRRRDRAVIALGAVAVAWTAIVAVMAQAGYTGSRRYLLVPAALECVMAGVGVAWLARGRAAIAIAAAALFAAFGLSQARENARLVSLAREQVDQLDELKRAVAKAGGDHAVLRAGDPAVNPYTQTPLAWELHAHLDQVQATWTRRDWAGPAFVFRAPARLAGPKPAIGGRHARPVTAAGRWRVLFAPRA